MDKVEAYGNQEMINFPKSTIVNRFIPKEKFYTKTDISNTLRQKFTDEIEKITWVNKISPETLNITASNFAELQVFEIKLKRTELSQATIKHIDTFIPYPILFLVKGSKGEKAIIAYKEQNQKTENKMKVDKLYETTWKQEVDLELKGRSVDEIYRNFLLQIAPQLNDNGAKATSTKDAVEQDKKREQLQKQIEAINRKMKSEPALAKKQELAKQRHELEKQINSS